MDNLQNQTQELLNNLLMGKIVKHDEVKALLRKVVKECCKMVCEGCKNNVPLIKAKDIGDSDWHFGGDRGEARYWWHDSDGDCVVCHASSIHCHLAWLLEGDK